MTSSDNFPSGIRVSLHNADLWNKFYPINEMIVKKGGRKLFPVLDVNIEGLDPDALYTVPLYLEKIGNYMYNFSTRTGQWEKAGISEKDLTVDKKQHYNGGMAGAHWMKRPVSFSDFRITNDSDDIKKSHSDNLILVSSSHKYQPVITVNRLSDGKEEEFRLTIAEFMAVTAYKNREIAELKKASNKHAFRFNGETQPYCGKKRAVTSEPSPTASPTGPASLSINTVTPLVGSPISSPAKKMAPPTPVPVHSQNRMKTSSPSTIPATVIISSVAANNSQVQMKTATSSTPPAIVPPYVAPINFLNQMMAPPTMAPVLMGLNNFQMPMINLPLMTPPFMAASLNQNFAIWNMLQNRMASMPLLPQLNMMHGGAQLGTQASHNSMEPDLTSSKAGTAPTSDSVVK